MLNARNGHKAHALSPLNRPKPAGIAWWTEVSTNQAMLIDPMHFSAPQPSVASQKTRAHLLNDVLPRRREMRRVAAAPQLEPYFAALRHTRMQSAVAREQQSGVRPPADADKRGEGRGIHRSGNASGWRNRIPPENGSKLP